MWLDFTGSSKRKILVCLKNSQNHSPISSRFGVFVSKAVKPRKIVWEQVSCACLQVLVSSCCIDLLEMIPISEFRLQVQPLEGENVFKEPVPKNMPIDQKDHGIAMTERWLSPSSFPLVCAPKDQKIWQSGVTWATLDNLCVLLVHGRVVPLRPWWVKSAIWDHPPADKRNQMQKFL